MNVEGVVGSIAGRATVIQRAAEPDAESMTFGMRLGGPAQ